MGAFVRMSGNEQSVKRRLRGLPKQKLDVGTKEGSA
jgi:hypothetical protein